MFSRNTNVIVLILLVKENQQMDYLSSYLVSPWQEIPKISILMEINKVLISTSPKEHCRISNSCVGGMEEGKSHLQWDSPCARRPPPHRLHGEDVEGARTNSHPIRTTTVLTSLGSIPNTDRPGQFVLRNRQNCMLSWGLPFSVLPLLFDEANECPCAGQRLEPETVPRRRPHFAGAIAVFGKTRLVFTVDQFKMIVKTVQVIYICDCIIETVFWKKLI